MQWQLLLLVDLAPEIAMITSHSDLWNKGQIYLAKVVFLEHRYANAGGAIAIQLHEKVFLRFAKSEHKYAQKRQAIEVEVAQRVFLEVKLVLH